MHVCAACIAMADVAATVGCHATFSAAATIMSCRAMGAATATAIAMATDIAIVSLCPSRSRASEGRTIATV